MCANTILSSIQYNGGLKSFLPFYLCRHPIFRVRKWKSLSRVRLFATPWTIQFIEFSRPGILEWGAFPFSRGSSQSRDQTQVSGIAGRFFANWATMEALSSSCFLGAHESLQSSVQLLSIILAAAGISWPLRKQAHLSGLVFSLGFELSSSSQLLIVLTWARLNSHFSSRS